MHLKRIRIYGFKSFAQEVVIDFARGITALVGPNGGGKSNVVDAIRWALGEQRIRELRAERWEDLLFHGASGRTPARLAEVVLEFDNHDGEIVHWPEALTVARRYYRSGDSEYLINGQAVRLKDVTDLFLDSGVGRHSYAIIGQGRVDHALLMKPDERLELLEEAAGVSRYKVRKKETLQHLHEVEAKLQRLDDLLAEVERQMGDVEPNALVETRYQTLEAERLTWQERLAYSEYCRAMARRQSLEARLQTLEQERQLINQELRAVEREVERLRDALRQDRAREAGDREVVDQLAQDEQRLVGAVHEAEVRLKALQREVALTEERLTDLTRRLEELRAEDEAIEETDEGEGERPVDGAWRLAYEEAEDLVKRLDDRLGDMRAARDALYEQRNALGKRWARIEGALQAHLSGEPVDASLTNVIEARKREMSQLETEVQRLSQEHREAVEERQQLVKVVGALEGERLGLSRNLAEAEARLKALAQLEAEGHGLSGGVRAVLKGAQNGHLKGIVGTLSSLVDVIPELNLAIDTALGSQAQDIVTDTEQSAREAVSFLKQNALGRATFLPLDIVRPAAADPRDIERLALEPGVIGWAARLVQYPGDIRPAVDHVLGRVLVVETLEDATRLGAIHRYRYKTVTRDGQVLHAGGALTGGSRMTAHHSWRDRRRDIGDLRDQLTRLRQALEAKERELQAARAALADTEQRVATLGDKLRTAQHAFQSLTQLFHMSGLEAEVTRLPAEMADVSRTIEELDAQVEELLDERRRAERAWQQLKVELEQREAAYQDLVQQQRERAVLRQRVREEMARIEQEEARYQQRRLRILDELAALEGTVSELSDQLTAVRSQKLAVRQRQEEDRRRADEMEARVTELERRQRLLESEERKMGQRMEAWRQELVAIQVRYEGYVPSDGVEPLTPLEEDKARQTLTRLQEELTLLGPVSPGSLALYEALKARYEFLQQERRDVVDARSELEATLKDIDRETEHRVRETKERVEARFRLAVQRLYGGGDGGFEWIAGDPPGIDLWVKPPGKRPGHLGLLSGGEKALGGIAWLFSLLSVRRAPFVVLDEVEASLDEASAARFAQYLKESDASVQYVIVTHHRQTMEAADVLWGVAADAEGQSRLISVKLEATDAVGAT